MTQSTLNSPWYQAMMAQVLRGPQRGPQYPAEAGLNAVGDLAQALQMKRMTDKGEAKDAATQSDNTNAYATALNNLGSKDNSTWDVGGGMDASGDPGQINVSPAVNASPAQRMAAALRGSPEMAQQMGPELAKQLTAPHPMSLGPTGQAYDPLTLKPGESPFGDPRIKSKEQLAQEEELKGAAGPAPQPTVGMTPEAEAQALRIAEANRKATLAAQQETWGQPVEEKGPDGKPIAVQYGNKGTRRVVEGAIPKGQQPTRQMQPKAINDLSAAGDQAAAMDRLTGGFKPEYGGHTVLGGLSNTIGRLTGDSTGQTQWWQDYQVQLNQMRNKLFGAALTAQEKSEFEKAVINPRMDPGEIQKNLQRQDQLATVAARKLAKAYTAAGYNKEAVEDAIGMSIEDLSGTAKPGPGDYTNPPQSGAAPQASGGWSVKRVQ